MPPINQRIVKMVKVIKDTIVINPQFDLFNTFIDKFMIFEVLLFLYCQYYFLNLKKLIIIIFLFPNFIFAACLNQFGQSFCAPPNGTVFMQYGSPVCGKGQCVQVHGSILCSKVSGGAAVLKYGAAKCVGGCEKAKRSYCSKL